MNVYVAFLTTVSLWLILLPSPLVCEDASFGEVLEGIVGLAKLTYWAWKYDGSEECTLPNQPEGGHYKLNGCQDVCNKDPGDRVDRNSILIYSCEENYVLNGSAFSVCINRTWFESQTCLKTCPPLESRSVDISCIHKGEPVSCTELVLPGTKAKLQCKSSYKLSPLNDPGFREIKCLNNGTWDNHVFRCLSECGTAIARGKPLIVNGYAAKKGVFPWYVGIYIKQGLSEYEQICGGTLISSNLVLSAAHCFYDDSTNQFYNISHYAVGASKYFRDWNAIDEFAQKSFIANIWPGERYLGMKGNYADDIVLLKLKGHFELNTLVRPVCMDWNNEYESEHLNVQRSGKVVGWGKDITGVSTKNLFEIDMPYVPYNQCKAEVPQNFQGLITLDKFCAGYANGSSVCDGDSGGGIYFEKNGLWFLRGIVSVSPIKDGGCDYESFVAFTSISNSRNWIRQIYAIELLEL